MTDQERKAMEMALEALEYGWNSDKEQAIEALRQALAQPEQYDQTTLELCDKCGWKTLIPDDCCLNCERNKQPNLRKAAEMALEALEKGTTGLAIRAIPALRQALAQDHGFDRTASHMAGEYVDTSWDTSDMAHRASGLSMEQEPVAWKPVVGYEEFYEVSSVGDLRDTKTKKIKSKSLMGAGYVKADLWANGARKQTSMHRLVAEAFLIPTGNANEVNHKNGIKTDNRVENLEWVTRSDNVNHSYYELKNQVKPISATHIETGNTLYYQSVEAAVRDGFCSAHISSVIAGRRKHHKGFVFKEAAPPSKPWVSLSDEEIKEGAKYSWVDYQAFQSVAWWADEKLKEKNT